jgi:hypothetical protein
MTVSAAQALRRDSEDLAAANHHRYHHNPQNLKKAK